MRSFMDKPENKNDLLDAGSVSVTTAYSGVVPPPLLLKQFNEVDPTFAERLFKMAEAQNEHSMSHENLVTKNEYKIKARGQISALLIVVLGYILAFVSLIFFNNTSVCVTSIITSTCTLAGMAVGKLLK